MSGVPTSPLLHCVDYWGAGQKNPTNSVEVSGVPPPCQNGSERKGRLPAALSLLEKLRLQS